MQQQCAKPDASEMQPQLSNEDTYCRALSRMNSKLVFPTVVSRLQGGEVTSPPTNRNTSDRIAQLEGSKNNKLVPSVSLTPHPKHFDKLATIRVLEGGEDILRYAVDNLLDEQHKLFDRRELLQFEDSTSSALLAGFNRTLNQSNSCHFPIKSNVVSQESASNSSQQFHSNSGRPLVQKRMFFTRLLDQRTSFVDWNATDVASAIPDIKHLNLSQLLYLCHLTESISKLHSQELKVFSAHCDFSDCIRNRLYVRLIDALFDRYSVSALTKGGSKSVNNPQSSLHHCRMVSDYTIRDKYSSGRSASHLEIKSVHWPTKWRFSLNPRELKALGRELLIVIGLGLQHHHGCLRSVCRQRKVHHPGPSSSVSAGQLQKAATPTERPSEFLKKLPSSDLYSSNGGGAEFRRRLRLETLRREYNAQLTSLDDDTEQNNTRTTASPKRSTTLCGNLPCGGDDLLTSSSSDESGSGGVSQFRFCSEQQFYDSILPLMGGDWWRIAYQRATPKNSALMLESPGAGRHEPPMSNSHQSTSASSSSESLEVSTPLKKKPIVSDSYRKGGGRTTGTPLTATVPHASSTDVHSANTIEFFLHIPSLIISVVRPPNVPIHTYRPVQSFTSTPFTDLGYQWEIFRFKSSAISVSDLAATDFGMMSDCVAELLGVLRNRAKHKNLENDTVTTCVSSHTARHSSGQVLGPTDTPDIKLSPQMPVWEEMSTSSPPHHANINPSSNDPMSPTKSSVILTKLLSKTRKSFLVRPLLMRTTNDCESTASNVRSPMSDTTTKRKMDSRFSPKTEKLSNGHVRVPLQFEYPFGAAAPSLSCTSLCVGNSNSPMLTKRTPFFNLMKQIPIQTQYNNSHSFDATDTGSRLDGGWSASSKELDRTNNRGSAPLLRGEKSTVHTTSTKASDEISTLELVSTRAPGETAASSGSSFCQPQRASSEQYFHSKAKKDEMLRTNSAMDGILQSNRESSGPSIRGKPYRNVGGGRLVSTATQAVQRAQTLQTAAEQRASSKKLGNKWKNDSSWLGRTHSGAIEVPQKHKHHQPSASDHHPYDASNRRMSGVREMVAKFENKLG